MSRVVEAYRHAASERGTVGEAVDSLVKPGLRAIAKNPVRWSLAFFAIGIVFGGTLFSFVEPDASIPDGMWWAFISMTTVGYGDLAPKDTFIRFIAVFVIVNGVLSVAVLTGAFGAKIVQLRVDQATDTPELEDDMEEAIEAINDKLRVVQARIAERDRELKILKRTGGTNG